MEWWIYLLSAVFGAGLTFVVQRLTLKEERSARQKAELFDAIHGLLMEINEHLKLLKIDPMGMRLLFPTDMWEIHKGKIATLPFTLQESLYEAYLHIRKINTVTQYGLASAAKDHVAAWDKRYRDEVSEANEPLSKARIELKKWLAEQPIESRGELTVISPIPYWKPSLPVILVLFIIMVAVALVFDLGGRGLSMMSHILGILSFSLLAFVVGIVLRHNPPNDTTNYLVRTKDKIKRWAKRRKHYWPWLGEHRAIEFLLLYIGVTFGLWALILGLKVIL